MLPLSTIFRNYSISYHCYADDLQFCFPVSLDKTCLLEILNFGLLATFSKWE